MVGCSNQPEEFCSYFNGWAMTMPYHITVGKKVNREEHLLIQSIVQNTFQEIDQTVNNWNPNSELSSINQGLANIPHTTSIHLNHILTLCNKITTLTDGRFDPTVAPLSKLWKNSLERGEVPTITELENVRKSVGWNHIQLKDDEVWKDADGTSLDLCALSKGYCIDLISERLKSAGFENLLVEWAGEIRALGKHPSGRNWTVQIEPSREQTFLINGAIATSGDYLQEWGQGYFHIIDPKSGKPMMKKTGSIKATTVIAPTCIMADALATSLMLFQTKEEAAIWGEAIVKEIPEVSFWIFTE